MSMYTMYTYSNVQAYILSMHYIFKANTFHIVFKVILFDNFLICLYYFHKWNVGTLMCQHTAVIVQTVLETWLEFIFLKYMKDLCVKSVEYSTYLGNNR